MFHESPHQSILVYVSAPGSESPERVLELYSIESVKLKSRKAARIELGDALDIDYAFRIRDLQEVNVKIIIQDDNVKTIMGEDVKLDPEEVGKRWHRKRQKQTKSADLDDAEIHILVKKQVKMSTKAEENLLVFSFEVVPLELVIYNPGFKFPHGIDEMIESTLDGLRSRILPERKTDGSSSGLYLMKDSSGKKIVSVFRPTNEESWCREYPLNPERLCKMQVEPGERSIREVAAYLLDHPRKGHRSVCSEALGFAAVPPTVMVRCLHYAFNSMGGMVWKTGSLQKYVQDSDFSDEFDPIVYSLDDIQRISLLDIRLANLHRDANNMLTWLDVRRFQASRLVPIDHGFCFPARPSEEHILEWMQWPKGWEICEPEIEEYVKKLDADKDIEYLKSYGWDMRPETERMLRICMMLLKIGVEKKMRLSHIATTLVTSEKSRWHFIVRKHFPLRGMVREAEKRSRQNPTQGDFFSVLSSIMSAQLDEMAATP